MQHMFFINSVRLSLGLMVGRIVAARIFIHILIFSRLYKRVCPLVGRSVCMERENFDDAKSTEKRISNHHSSYLASIQPPPTHILPLPTRITAPAHQQRLRIGRVSGLVLNS